MAVDNIHFDMAFLCATLRNTDVIKFVAHNANTNDPDGHSRLLLKIINGFATVGNGIVNDGKVHTVKNMNAHEYVMVSRHCNELFMSSEFLDICVARYNFTDTTEPESDKVESNEVEIEIP